MIEKKVLSDQELTRSIRMLNTKLESYKGTMSAFFTSVFILGFGGAFMAFIGVLTEDSPLLYIFVIFSLTAFGGVFIYNKKIGKLENQISRLLADNVTASILHGHFEVDHYDTLKHFSLETVREAEIFNKVNRVLGSDRLCARYNGIRFQFSDVNISRQIPGTGGEHSSPQFVTMLHGQWITCFYNQGMNAPIIIRDRGLGDAKHQSNFVTQHDEFDANYSVYTTNHEETRKFLTPQYIKTLLDIKHNIGGYYTIIFMQDCMHIAIHTGKDFFELEQGASNMDVIRKKFQNEISTIKAIIDTLTTDIEYF